MLLLSVRDSALFAPPKMYDREYILLQVISPSGNTIDITMDDEFRITQIVQPDGGTWTYEYDEAGDLVSATNPAGNERRYSKIDYMENKLDMVNIGLLLIFAIGIRVGELAAVKPEDINGNMMHVQRTEICYVAEVDAKTGKTTNAYDIEEYPKSEAGDRYVVIPDESMWVIKRAREH